MKAQRRQQELWLAAAEAELEVWAGSAVGVGTELKGQGVVVLKVEDLEAGQAVWPGCWEWVLGLLDGYQKWAEGPLDEPLE